MAARSPESIFLKRLGLRLREIRQSRGWTLEEAEEHGYASWRHLQKIEAGKNITMTTLYRLSRLYDVELSYLLKSL
jgi:transcriptional regulator with XRE-family HTH domain